MFGRIAETREVVNRWWKKNVDSVFWSVFLFLAVVLGAGIAQLWMLAGAKPPVQFMDSSGVVTTQETLHQRYIQASGLPGLVAASRNGKRYYYPWCGGMKQIKKKNLIWFGTEQEAEMRGYTIAKGCEGLW